MSCFTQTAESDFKNPRNKECWKNASNKNSS